MAKSDQTLEMELIDLIYRTLDESRERDRVQSLASRYFVSPALPGLLAELLTAPEEHPADLRSGQPPALPPAPTPGAWGSRTLANPNHDALSAMWRMQGSLPPRDRERWLRLVPHIVRARDLRQVLQRETLSEAANRAALLRIRLGIVLIGGEGQVVLANELAAPAFDPPREGVRSGTPRLDGTWEKHVLQQRVRAAVASLANRGAGASQMVYLRDNFAATPAQILVCRLAERTFAGVPFAKFVLFVFDPSRPVALNLEVLQRLQGYTAAEARIAQAVADGLDVKEIARELGVIEDTVRAHLKAMFRKTGVRRQTELMKALLLGAAAHAVGDLCLDLAP